MGIPADNSIYKPITSISIPNEILERRLLLEQLPGLYGELPTQVKVPKPKKYKPKPNHKKSKEKPKPVDPTPLDIKVSFIEDSIDRILIFYGDSVFEHPLQEA